MVLVNCTNPSYTTYGYNKKYREEKEPENDDRSEGLKNKARNDYVEKDKEVKRSHRKDKRNSGAQGTADQFLKLLLRWKSQMW